MVRMIDELVRLELFPSRSEFIREAIRAQLKRYIRELQNIPQYQSISSYDYEE